MRFFIAGGAILVSAAIVDSNIEFSYPGLGETVDPSPGLGIYAAYIAGGILIGAGFTMPTKDKLNP